MFSLSSMKKRNDFVWYFLVAPDDVGEGMEESLGCSATVSGLEIMTVRLRSFFCQG